MPSARVDRCFRGSHEHSTVPLSPPPAIAPTTTTAAPTVPVLQCNLCALLQAKHGVPTLLRFQPLERRRGQTCINRHDERPSVASSRLQHQNRENKQIIAIRASEMPLCAPPSACEAPSPASSRIAAAALPRAGIFGSTAASFSAGQSAEKPPSCRAARLMVLFVFGTRATTAVAC